MATKAASVWLLREVADAVERLGEARVRYALREALEHEGQARLPLGRNVNSKRSTVVRTASPLRNALIEQSLQNLRVSESREDGIKRIRESGFSRRELERLARLIDVPVRKDQNVQDLEELIVNVTIGGRLNSQAIRYGK